MRQVSYLAAALLMIFSVVAAAGQAVAGECESIEYYSVTITSTGTPTTPAAPVGRPSTDCWAVCFPHEIISNVFGPMAMSLANLNTSTNHWGALGLAGFLSTSTNQSSALAPASVMFYGSINHFKRIQADGMDLFGSVYKIVGVNDPEACSSGSPSN